MVTLFGLESKKYKSKVIICFNPPKKLLFSIEVIVDFGTTEFNLTSKVLWKCYDVKQCTFYFRIMAKCIVDICFNDGDQILHCGVYAFKFILAVSVFIIFYYIVLCLQRFWSEGLFQSNTGFIKHTDIGHCVSLQDDNNVMIPSTRRTLHTLCTHTNITYVWSSARVHAFYFFPKLFNGTYTSAMWLLSRRVSIFRTHARIKDDNRRDFFFFSYFFFFSTKKHSVYGMPFLPVCPNSWRKYNVITKITRA